MERHKAVATIARLNCLGRHPLIRPDQDVSGAHFIPSGILGPSSRACKTMRMKQQNRRRIGRRDEPLAMPRRSPKVPPTQRALQSRGAHAAQHAAVAYQNFADARAGVARQHAAETLDVRKLGQSARAGHSGRICTLRHLMGPPCAP